MIKIVHIITGLGSGGAENMLYKFLKYSDKEKYSHEVISLTDDGVIGQKIKTLGINVNSLNIKKNKIIKSLFMAKKICKNFDIISTWLYHADIFGFIVAKILLRKKIIWNIRHCNLEKDVNKKSTLRIVKINSYLSKFANAITYNSKKAFSNHKLIGYKNKNSIIFYNGFELNEFRYSYEDRIKLRKNLCIKEDVKVIITVGRWDAQKDYNTLIKALVEVKLKYDFLMLMVGTNLTEANNDLYLLLKENNLLNNVLLLGRQENISAFLSAADLYVSSSVGESFSNAIGEAMACELPCVVTDVGDSRYIVGDTGITVHAKDYIGMSNAITSSFQSSVNVRCYKARDRIIQNFNIQDIVNNIEKIIMTLL